MQIPERMFRNFNREKIRHELWFEFSFLRTDSNAVNFIGQRSLDLKVLFLILLYQFYDLFSNYHATEILLHLNICITCYKSWKFA